MSGTKIVARLSKAGDRVLCGRPLPGGGRCGGRILQLIEVGPETVKAAKPGTEILYTQTVRFWAFPAGWVEVHGVWQETKSAKERREWEQRRASGNSLNWSVPDSNAARYRLATGLAESNRRGHVQDWAAKGAQVMRRAPLPTLARCPKCHGINRLDRRLEPKVPIPQPERQDQEPAPPD